MLCDDVRAVLFEHAAALLAGADRGAIEQHLGHCGECRRALDDIRSFAADAATWQAAPPPRMARPSTSRAVWLPLAAAAMLALAVIAETRVEVGGDSMVALSFGGGEVDTTIREIEAEQDDLRRQLAGGAPIERSQLVADLVELTRAARRDELRAVLTALTAEFDQQNLETDETMRYLVAHQIEDQQELQRLSDTLKDLQRAPGARL